MAKDTIVALRNHLVEAAAGFPGAVGTEIVEDETGMFSVELESGEELFVAIAAVTV
ncbi:hypothetical protein [Actinomadura sp. 9N215]|uniref:hypothetical protein n=1 Tax=Actinomadura sp. 9N215 TaxID=3375150 RepID=UPI00378DB100